MGIDAGVLVDDDSGRSNLRRSNGLVGVDDGVVRASVSASVSLHIERFGEPGPVLVLLLGEGGDAD